MSTRSTESEDEQEDAADRPAFRWREGAHRAFSSLRDLSGEAEPVLRARWAQQFYYTHVREYRESVERGGSSLFDVFDAMLPLNSLEPERALTVRRILEELQHINAETLINFVEERWCELLRGLPDVVRVAENMYSRVLVAIGM